MKKPLSETAKQSPNQAHGLSNIIVNVIIPVLVLNRLTARLGPGAALGLALAFPLCFGLYDWIKRKRTNYFSVLGLINVSLTGSLALLQLDGMWFAVKEAVFPTLIGVFVYASSFSKTPFIETLILNPQLMQIDLIHERLEAQGKWTQFEFYMRRATQMLAFTFLVSAVVNFTLAIHIFIPLDHNLDSTTRSVQLNDQIAHMTMWASAVIIVPSILMLSGILWYLIKGIRTATGLTTEQILKN
jgi:hypothetical protein